MDFLHHLQLLIVYFDEECLSKEDIKHIEGDKLDQIKLRRTAGETAMDFATYSKIARQNKTTIQFSHQSLYTVDDHNSDEDNNNDKDENDGKNDSNN